MKFMRHMASIAVEVLGAQGAYRIRADDGFEVLALTNAVAT